MIPSARVRKNSNTGKGELGVVESIVVKIENGENCTKVRVKADGGKSWPLQAAANFTLLEEAPTGRRTAQSPERSERSSFESPNISPQVRSRGANVPDSGPETAPKSPPPPPQTTAPAGLRVGDVVNKWTGERQGEGRVVEIFSDGRVKCTPDAGGTWPKQSAGNFEKLRWNKDRLVAYPGEFENCQMSQHQSEGGVLYVWWRGKRYSEAKWDQQRAEWAAAYPHIVTSTGGTRTIFESSADRSRIMTRRFLGTLFEKLGTDNAYIPFRFQEDFRVDMGGDVVSPRAQNFSVCMYDGDHVFPWSRGGLTHTSNMAALQFYANRWVKGDRLLPELTRDSMLCGISAPQFAALLAEVGRRTPRVYVHGAEEEGGGRGGYEARLAQAEQLAVMWLLIPIPLSGLNIQALLRGCSGGDIYDFFEGMSRLPAKRAAP